MIQDFQCYGFLHHTYDSNWIAILTLWGTFSGPEYQFISKIKMIGIILAATGSRGILTQVDFTCFFVLMPSSCNLVLKVLKFILFIYLFLTILKISHEIFMHLWFACAFLFSVKEADNAVFSIDLSEGNYKNQQHFEFFVFVVSQCHVTFDQNTPTCSWWTRLDFVFKVLIINTLLISFPN